MESTRGEMTVIRHEESWNRWPVYWGAVWAGALTAIVLALMVGLIGIALGAHHVGTGQRIVRWGDYGLGALFFSVFGAFLAFAIGGWVASKIAGIRRSEPAMLHGAIVWLLAVPLLLVLVALGAGSLFGGWYGGLAGTPAWVTTPAGTPDPNAAVAARNAALGALTALLLGLVGSVVGGWMASGEPMNFTHHRTRPVSTARRSI